MLGPPSAQWKYLHLLSSHAQNHLRRVHACLRATCRITWKLRQAGRLGCNLVCVCMLWPLKQAAHDSASLARALHMAGVRSGERRVPARVAGVWIIVRVGTCTVCKPHKHTPPHVAVLLRRLLDGAGLATAALTAPILCLSLYSTPLDRADRHYSSAPSSLILPCMGLPGPVGRTGTTCSYQWCTFLGLWHTICNKNSKRQGTASWPVHPDSTPFLGTRGEFLWTSVLATLGRCGPHQQESATIDSPKQASLVPLEQKR